MIRYFDTRREMVAAMLKEGMTGAKVGTTCFDFNAHLLATNPRLLYLIEIGQNSVYDSEDFIFRWDVAYDNAMAAYRDKPCVLSHVGGFRDAMTEIPDGSLDFVYLDVPVVVDCRDRAGDVTPSIFREHIFPKLKPDALVFGSHFDDVHTRRGLGLLLQSQRKSPVVYTREVSGNNMSWCFSLENQPLKINVVQVMIDDKPFYALSEKLARAYCEKHGYAYHVEKSVPPHHRDYHRSVRWEKVPAVQKHLHDCDFVCYVDADAMFYNDAVRLEPFVVDMPVDTIIRVAKDVRDESTRYKSEDANTGVCFVRNVPESHEFLGRWNKCSDENPSWRTQHPCEQLAFNWLRYKKPYLIDRYDEYYQFNGKYGMFIRHFMTCDDSYTHEMMFAKAREEGLV